MKSFVSVNEVNELCEALILDFMKSTKHICVDIEGFITDYLNLNIVYIPFAETDTSKFGFLSDGKQGLWVYRNKKKEYVVFSKYTIVIDQYLLVRDENEFRFMIEQIDVEFKAAKKIIYTCATDKFKSLSDNCDENVTQALIDYFADKGRINAISYDLLIDTIEKIFVGTSGSISMIFVNNKELKYLKGVAEDAGNKNCY